MQSLFDWRNTAPAIRWFDVALRWDGGIVRLTEMAPPGVHPDRNAVTELIPGDTPAALNSAIAAALTRWTAALYDAHS